MVAALSTKNLGLLEILMDSSLSLAISLSLSNTLPHYKHLSHTLYIALSLPHSISMYGCVCTYTRNFLITVNNLQCVPTVD